MTMFKKGTCDSLVVVSSSVYTCEKCGHVEIVEDDKEETRQCPKCSSSMKIISAHAEETKTPLE